MIMPKKLVNFVGIGLAMNNLLSLVALVLPITFALLNRIKIEEKLLVENFDESYRYYKAKTWALFPLIY